MKNEKILIIGFILLIHPCLGLGNPFDTIEKEPTLELAYSSGLLNDEIGLEPTWSRIFKQPGEQVPRGGKLVHTTDGGFLIGSTTILETGYREYWLLKTDADGVEQWNASYKYFMTGYTGMVWLTNIIQTSDNGFTLIGTTETSSDWDVWLLRIDENGVEEWNQTYDGPENNRDYASAVYTTPDGGYLIGAFTRDPATTGNNYLFDYWLIKTDANGIEQWNRTYDGLGNDESFPFIPTKDGNFLFGGPSASSNDGIYQIWLIKVNTSGNILWEQYYSATNTSESLAVMKNALIETADGGILLAGYTSSAGTDWWDTGYDYHIIKTDAAGEIEWTQEFGEDYNDIALVALQTTKGEYYIGGSYRKTSGDYTVDDMCLIKLSSSGEILWNFTYGEASVGDFIADMVQIENSEADEALIVLGGTESFGAEDLDVWLGKFEIYSDTTTSIDTSTSTDSTTTSSTTNILEESSSTASEDNSGFDLITGTLVLVTVSTLTGFLRNKKRNQK
ncbi:MAG: hypothetical protein ACFFCQ_06420 [Promethearchaeota archaeon]